MVSYNIFCDFNLWYGKKFVRDESVYEYTGNSTKLTIMRTLRIDTTTLIGKDIGEK